MTLKELIAELSEIANEYGENTVVVVKHFGEEGEPPILSVAPPNGGGPVIVTVL